jgi:hypothetical protein
MSLLMVPSARAQNQQYDLCFPNVAWFANNSTSPVIDGCIENCATGDDAGWRGGSRYVFDNATNGTPLPNVSVLGVRDANNIYLGFEFHKSAPADPNDVIIIGLDPTGNAADRRLIDIFPYTSGGSTANSVPHAAPLYFVGSSTFPTLSPLFGGTPAPLPTWLQAPSYANLRIATVATTMGTTVTDYFYSVELRIPLTGTDALPALTNGGAGNFGLYLDVIRLIGGGAAEDSWPAPPETAQASGLMAPPLSNTWGVGSFNGLCNGVSVASITANGGTTQLNLASPNNFSVVVQNNTRSSESFANQPSGTPVLAPKVNATLRLGIFGIPNMDQSIQVPMPGNPAAPQDIPANSSVTYNMGPWNIPPTSDPALPPNDNQAYFGANPHQCVMALLNSSPPSSDPSCKSATETPWCYHANILNNAAVQNMNFGTVSEGAIFRGPIAQIATKGYTLQPDNHQTFVMQIRSQLLAPITKPDQRATLSTNSQALLWTVHGYRQVGNTITINQKTYPIMVDAGSFGYKLGYSAAVPEWRYQFFGENGSDLEQLDNNTYRMRIAQDAVGFVNATFEGDAAAGTGGPIHPGGGGRFGHFWWWIALVLLLLLLLVALIRRRKHV